MTRSHVVSGLTNGTTYTFKVQAVNSSGGGAASGERSAVPSTTPGAPTNLRATASDEDLRWVRLRWDPAADGGGDIIRYECHLRIGGQPYVGSCASKSLGASATSLTLTDEDVLYTDEDGAEERITNGTTYTFRVRAVNDRVRRGQDGNGAWSNEATAKPTDGTGTQRTFTISATIDGKSWARVNSVDPLVATVEVDPSYTAPSTMLWVRVVHGAVDYGSEPVRFGPTNRPTSRRDVSFTGTWSDDITIALVGPADPADPAAPPDPPDPDNLSNALAVTSVEIRPGSTPDPPTGLEATRGDGEVTLSWATDVKDTVDDRYDYDYRQRRERGIYGRWTDFAGVEFRSTTDGDDVTSNIVTGLTNGGTYAFQVRAVATTGGISRIRIMDAESDPSDEVTVSLSGTVETGGLSVPRNFDAAAGDREVTLSWTAPAADGGAAIIGYEYQLRAGRVPMASGRPSPAAVRPGPTSSPASRTRRATTSGSVP